MAEVCKVCANAVRRPGIDAALAQGLSAAAIARDQTATGFAITGPAITHHSKHYAPPLAVTNPGARGRDAAIIIRDKVLDALEKREERGSYKVLNPKTGEIEELDHDILDKELQPALGTALKAQAELNRAAKAKGDKGIRIEMSILLAGGPPPAHLVGPGVGEVVEGSFEEVVPGDPD